MNMVEENAVERPIDSIIEKVHEPRLVLIARILRDFRRRHFGGVNHVGHEGEGQRGEESARFGNPANAFVVREQIFERLTND